MDEPVKARAAAVKPVRGRPRGEGPSPDGRRLPRPPADSGGAIDRSSPIDLGGLDQFVGYVVRRAQVWIFQDVKRPLKELDITPAQFSVMKLVSANAGLAQVRVAEALCIERARLVQMLDKLETRGLIKRTRSARDRRSHALHLTADGAAMLERLIALMGEHERRVVEKIGTKGKAELLRILAPFLR